MRIVQYRAVRNRNTVARSAEAAGVAIRMALKLKLRQSLVPAHLISRRPILRSYFEAAEIEAGRDRAAGQRPIPLTAGGLPYPRGHNDLRAFSARDVVAEYPVGRRSGTRRLAQGEQGTRIPVPNLGGVNAMPVRDLVRLRGAGRVPTPQ